MTPYHGDLRWSPRRRPAALMLFVLAAHLALLLGWNPRTAPRRLPASGAPEVWTWLLRPAGQPATTPAPATPPGPAAVTRRAPDRPSLRSPADSTAPPLQPWQPEASLPRTEASEPTPGPPLAATVPEPSGAAASSPTGSTLMTGDATRRALRDVARQPLLSERAAQATAQPFRRGAERLAEAASAAGKGDCLQGDYAGGGMGLLSLPFLAVAAARGQCSR